MNINELKAAIARKGLSVSKLADLIGMGKKAIYSRLSGKSDFKQGEISLISKVLELTDEQILDIFFAVRVEVEKTAFDE